MNDGFDDLARLRIARQAFRRPGPLLASGGSPGMIGRVTTASPMVGTFCLVNPLATFGSESEGSAPTFAVPDVDARVAVYLLGPAAPVTGDNLPCRYVDHRWVAERMSSGGGSGGTTTLFDCFCSPIPTTLTMTSYSATCNYGMFQSGTIQYGPTPASYLDLNIGVNSFLGVESFPDVTANGAMFRYLLTCLYNQFNLTRVYLESPYGSPYRDGILYTWLVGGYGNTCDPFHLDDGLAYAGSDPSCFVTIDAA